MIARFCLYSVLKNLRFADPFFVLYLLSLGRTFTEIGLLFGYQHLLTVTMEVPSGYLADRCGRRRALIGCFFAYFLTYAVLALCSAIPSGQQLWGLYGALTCFGLGEALRTGSHKAIMLDYLDVQGQPERGTEVIGLARSFSKYSAGASAVCGGLILFIAPRYDVLFWLSALPAAAGMVLIWTYPRYLDGECSRGAAEEAPPAILDWRAGLRAVFAQPRTLGLLLQSVLFESQVKVILKYYAQPMLTTGLARYGIVLAESAGAHVLQRSGALWIGAFELFRESLGGLAAQSSRRLERSQASPLRALDLCYALAALLGLVVVGSFFIWNDWLAAAAIYFVLLTLLQNVRRPVFVSALNVEMEKSMRATILSLDSVSRSIVLALMLPLMGIVADRFGLRAALWLPPLVLLAGWPLGGRRRVEMAADVAAP